MTEKTCDHCRWWNKDDTWTVIRPPHQMQGCVYYLNHPGKSDTALITCSGPKFSCKHWEQKR